MTNPWTPASFEIARAAGPCLVIGFTYRGLGMQMLMKGSPKGRRPPTWALSHLGTGHRLAKLTADEPRVFQIATEIAEAGTWDFLSMQGWKDRFPDAPQALDAIARRHAGFVKIARARRI